MQRRGINISFNLGSASILFFGVYSFYKGCSWLIQSSHKIQLLKKQQIQSLDQDALNKMQGLAKRIALLKLYCKNAPEFKQQSGVSQNHRQAGWYPTHENESKMVRQLQNLLPHQGNHYWSSQEIAQTLVLPQIANTNMFTMKHRYKLIQRGYLSSILYKIELGLALFVDLIVNIILIMLSRNEQSAKNHTWLLLNWPAEGILTSTFSLIKDCPLIVECQIQNGIITPKMIGLRKEDILNIYDSQKKDSIITMFLAALLLYLCRNRIKRDFLDPLWKGLKWLFSREPKQSKAKGRLLNAQVQNDLQCIICMHRCRNVIFENCRHFAICNECKAEYGGEQIHLCPLCRRETQEKYIFVQSYEEMAE